MHSYLPISKRKVYITNRTNIVMPKRKRMKKPTDDFFSIGVGKIDQQTPTTQLTYSIMQKVYDLFAS